MSEAMRTSRREPGVDPSRASMTSAHEATVLAFDFGERRVGVAIGNTLVRHARALATIDAQATEARFAAITSLIEEWRPDALVVGVPLHADGSEHAMTRRARRFARQLAERFRLPVAEADERYTTQEAASLVKQARGGRAGREQRDAVAAQVILQAWLDEGGVATR
jgi:putative Holliday junction resolvase